MDNKLELQASCQTDCKKGKITHVKITGVCLIDINKKDIFALRYVSLLKNNFFKNKILKNNKLFFDV